MAGPLCRQLSGAAAPAWLELALAAYERAGLPVAAHKVERDARKGLGMELSPDCCFGGAPVARRQQVWLFTCHPRTAKLVTSVDPSAGVLRLRRGGKVVGLDRREIELPDDGGADATPTLQFDD